ncbi:M23 family metallopeptidase [Gulosibacter sp. 10]|uniref:M23 family metallopeptidase n=1 Tax=Gulosibacter sp. 10 TaxID=1255570 RepID=UPI00097E805B|nr:M23 family metallopeptidase [Gulosibacter sp. 10]SJM59161.1 Membrane proteins related to metalloendopeptidases [Gulosibacter sp. 10]
MSFAPHKEQLAAAPAVEPVEAQTAPTTPVEVPEPASDAAGEAAPRQYLTRRERREAERAAELAAAAEAARKDAEERARLVAQLEADKVSALHSEPETLVEDAAGDDIPESFRAGWQSGRTRRMVRLPLSGRRVAASSIAISALAGTAVLGAGSAAAYAAMNGSDAELEGAHTANLASAGQGTAAEAAPEQAVEPATGTEAEPQAASAETDIQVTKPEIEATSVYSFDADTLAGVAATDVETVTGQGNASVQWPVPVGTNISSGFGPRAAPLPGASTFHNGVDFVPGAGTPVGSMAEGTVSLVSNGGTTYGVYVEVEHEIDGQKVTTVYAHLQAGSVSVVEGQSIAAGEQIGAVGNTGNSSGAHLHFEVKVEGTPVDPIGYLP